MTPVKPRATHLVATRTDRPEHTPEAEPVVVETTADVVRLVLDGGEVIDFDAVELRAAIGARAA